MKIKVSKAFAAFMNKTFKANGLNYRASVVELSERAYFLNVSGTWGDDLDYNINTGLFKAIRVEYPANYYACPLYLSTAGLVREFRSRGVTTFDALSAMIVDMCEI